MTTVKLTDTQLVLLSAASQRQDGLIAIGERLKGGAAKTAGECLLAAGWAHEVTVRPDDPVWRTNDEGQAIGLLITQSGLAAIGLGSDEDESLASGSVSQEADTALAFRPGSKLSGVIAILAAPDGASIGELTTSTGWLPHSARAALTGLRKKGFVITRQKRVDGATAYYLAGTEAGGAS